MPEPRLDLLESTADDESRETTTTLDWALPAPMGEVHDPDAVTE